MRTVLTMTALLLFGVCAANAGTSLILPNLTPYQVMGVQCGTGTSITTGIGFSDNGGYALGFAEASTRCGGSGRGGGYHTTTYHGCAIVRYTLTGQIFDYSRVACSIQDGTASFTSSPGYGESTSAGHAILTLPDETPTYTWKGAEHVEATIGQTTSFQASLINNSSVPLYIYGVDAHAVGYNISVSFDATSCTDIYMQPGESCPVTVNIYVGGETTGTQTVNLSAVTSSLTETTFAQTVQPIEVDLPPPPPPSPGTTVTVTLEASACDVAFVCALVSTAQDPVAGGQLDLSSGSILLTNADGTTENTYLDSLAITALDDVNYQLFAGGTFYDANAIPVQTVSLNITLAFDGVNLSVINGTLSITTLEPATTIAPLAESGD